MAIKLHDSFAVHPGAWLRAEIGQPAEWKRGHVLFAGKVRVPSPQVFGRG
jgi:hypothetical protein